MGRVEGSGRGFVFENFPRLVCNEKVSGASLCLTFYARLRLALHTLPPPPKIVSPSPTTLKYLDPPIHLLQGSAEVCGPPLKKVDPHGVQLLQSVWSPGLTKVVGPTVL